MRVRILGPLEVRTKGQIIQIGGARLRALLIRLALDPGQVVAAERLSRALWPDDGPTDRAHALHSLVSRLRRALPSDVPLLSVSGGYRLDLPPDDVDALLFERWAREGRSALLAGRAVAAARQLHAALELWRGEALADVAEMPFAVAPAARLSELWLAATEDRIDADLASLGPDGRPGPWAATGSGIETADEEAVATTRDATVDTGAIVAELEALTAIHPLRERLRVLLVRALAADGRRAEALAAFEHYRRLLAEELGADPGQQLREEHLAVLRTPSTPRKHSTTRPQGNMRVPLTSFIGREDEQKHIERQLGDGRLVTLVGPGGSGKTRLAAMVAARLAADLSGGAWWVELASVTDPGDVPHAVIDALGLRDAGIPDARSAPRDPTSRLAEALPGVDTLIVLDNCEHVVDAAARLVDHLLSHCPLLRIITTSREPLGLAGERLCPVLPLALPDPEAATVDAMAFPAIRLFADRAAATRPDFTLSEQNLGNVVEICRRLDGLPLAIELAAARLRVLTVEQLAARLNDRFPVLAGGSRTAPSRHQSLRAVVGWSWDLLSTEEARLARRLAVFPGGITPEAAAEVCATGPSTLELLFALVDKSLLHLIETPDPRYRMLETIREYALDRLAAAGEVAELRTAHARYFLDLAERAEPYLRSSDQVAWIRTVAAERDNLVATLHFARNTGDAQTAVRLAAALGHAWTAQANHVEAAGWIKLALDTPGEAPRGARAAALAAYVLNAVLSGTSPAPDLIDQARAGIVESVTEPVGAVLLEPLLAYVDDNLKAGLAAVARGLSHPDDWTRAMLRLVASFLRGNAGDIVGMRSELVSATTEFRIAGDRWGLATSLAYLGYIDTTLGAFDDAVAALGESVAVLRELDPADPAVLQRLWIVDARRRKGDVTRARADVLELVAPDARTHSVGAVLARIKLGDLARDDGDLDGAAREYDRAEHSLRGASLHAPGLSAMLSAARAQLATTTDRTVEAEQHIAQAMRHAIEAQDIPLVAFVAIAVAGLRLRTGATDRAAEILGAAHALRGAPDESNPDVVRVAKDLTAELGERAYQAAYARGRRLDRAGALALVEDQARRR